MKNGDQSNSHQNTRTAVPSKMREFNSQCTRGYSFLLSTLSGQHVEHGSCSDYCLPRLGQCADAVGHLCDLADRDSNFQG